MWPSRQKQRNGRIRIFAKGYAEKGSSARILIVDKAIRATTALMETHTTTTTRKMGEKDITYRSTATTSALAIFPAVKMLEPLRPFPVLASGKSPFSVRRSVKNVLGTWIEKKPSGSTKSFISVVASAGVVVVSSAHAANGEKLEETAPAAVDPMTPEATLHNNSRRSVAAAFNMEVVVAGEFFEYTLASDLLLEEKAIAQSFITATAVTKAAKLQPPSIVYR